MDEKRIDSHKLHLHPRRVADWLEGKDIAPIYMEVSPSGACNHRCAFCGLDFMGYQSRYLPTDIFIERLAEMGQAGVKSIMYAGEGEPFLHKDMAQIAVATKQVGIDVAFTTNAVLLKPEIAKQVLPVSSWIKVSCNGGTPEVHAKIHGTKEADFHKVMDNMAQAVKIREEQGSSCTLGFQMVLLPENEGTAVELAKRVRDIGADYLVIKPYTIHRQSTKDAYLDLSYGDSSTLVHNLAELNTETFEVIFRSNTLERFEKRTHDYSRCLALPFWNYIDSGGNVWGCLRHLQEEDFNYGNILEVSFKDIVWGSLRRERMVKNQDNCDISECHLTCRMDAINSYLWELKQPHKHVNFV